MDRMISVIMSVYAEPVAWLEASINSVLGQSYDSFEFVIISDNPDNADALRLIEQYAERDKRVVHIRNQSNIGLTKSLNKGLSISKGGFIARMDADDIAHPDRFQKQIQFLMNHPDISICSSDARMIDEDDNIIAETRVHGQLNLDELFVCSPLIHPSVMFRRSLLALRQPFYNEQYRVSQDYELWTYLYLNKARFGIIPETLIDYRVSPKQISNHNKGTQSQYSSQIGRLFYDSMMARVVPQSDKLSLKEQLVSLSGELTSGHIDDKQMYFEMLYRQYYTVSRTKRSYIFKYFCDSNLLPFKLSFRKTIYLVLSLFFKSRYDKMFLLYY